MGLWYNFWGLIPAADEREERKACCGTSSILSDRFRSPRLENVLLMKHTRGPWHVAGSMRITAERVSIAFDVLNSEYLFSDTPWMIGADNAIHKRFAEFLQARWSGWRCVVRPTAIHISPCYNLNFQRLHSPQLSILWLSSLEMLDLSTQ